MGTTSLPESIINSICEEISENYKKDNSFLPYVEKKNHSNKKVPSSQIQFRLIFRFV